MTPTPALPMWLEVLKAVAPLIAALLAAGVGAYVAHKFGTIQAGIAQQQAETAKAAAATARNKLKFDLFNQRLEIYNRVMGVIVTALQTGEHSASNERDFFEGINGARWLFDKQIYDYLNGELRDDLSNLHLANANLKDAGKERKELAETRSKAFVKVRNHFNKIDEVFAPALQLSA